MSVETAGQEPGRRPRHPNKRIVKVDENHWVVSCRRCGKRSRRGFASQGECEDYYVEHAVTEYHRQFERRKVMDSPEVALLQRIFEDSKMAPGSPEAIGPVDQRPAGSENDTASDGAASTAAASGQTP